MARARRSHDTVIGLVWYADDPHKRVFRKVFLSPGDPESELDNPRWVKEGCDPARVAVIRKIPDKELAQVGLLESLAVAEAAAKNNLLGLIVGFVPSPPQVVAAMLDLAEVSSADVVMDLGCGDGRILVEAAKRGAKAIGIDLDPEQIAQSKESTAGLPVELREANLVGADFSDASVITIYLVENIDLILDFKSVRPGTRIVTHNSDFTSRKPTKSLEVSGRTVNLYVA